jgi:hypothetical protein
VSDSEQSSNLYIWQSGPRAWMTMHPQSGLGSAGESRAEALDVFQRTWNDRSTVRLVEHAPPRAGTQVERAGDRAIALTVCHAKWSQRLRLAARDGLVDSIEAAAALDELFELATK